MAHTAINFKAVFIGLNLNQSYKPSYDFCHILHLNQIKNYGYQLVCQWANIRLQTGWKTETLYCCAGY
jgi:hypothetical protein